MLYLIPLITIFLIPLKGFSDTSINGEVIMLYKNDNWRDYLGGHHMETT